MSSRRSLFLLVRVRVWEEGKRRVRLFLPLALYVPYHTLLSFEELLSLIPGRPGRVARAGVGAACTLLLGMMAQPPQTYADIDVEEKESKVMVRIETTGIGEGS